MTIGWCAPLHEADRLCRLGYDYIELPLAGQFIEGSDAERAACRKAVTASPLPTLAFNYFFPQDMRIVGKDVDIPRLDTYLARAAELLAAAKGRVAVMGSAWARNVPEGFDRTRAKAQILDVLSLAADRLHGSGCALVIEPLYRQESNIINSVSEAVEYARTINRHEIRVLADFFHMDEEQEPLETLLENRDWLAHIHLADTGRMNPGTGNYPYDRFFEILRRSNYQGLLSAECRVDDPEIGMPKSLYFIRKHWPFNASLTKPDLENRP